MKSKVLSILIVILLITSVITFFACSDEDSVIEYNNTISSRYADSFKIIEKFAAPSTAIEYLEEERVDKKILIDTRIVGLHYLGLYAPKGEEITIIIPQDYINLYTITINKDLENEESILLENQNTKITSTNGGILELYTTDNENEPNCFTMQIKGAIESSYYRYSIDSEDTLKNNSKYSVLDASNIRFYLEKSDIAVLDDPAKVLFFWQNAISFIDKALNLSFYEQDYTPVRVYLINETYSYNEGKNIIYLPKSAISTILSIDKLMTGDDAKLLDIFKKISLEKVIKSKEIINEANINRVNEVIAAFTYAKMVNSFKANHEKRENYILSEASCLEMAINKSYQNDLEKYVSLLMIIYYEIGEDTILDSFINKVDDIVSIADFIVALSDNAKLNTLELLELYEIKDQLTQEQVDKLAKHNKLNLVANHFTHGAVINNIQTGIHFKYGIKEVIDFKSAIISNDENWVVEHVDGRGWSKVDDGKYAYSPNHEILQDNFKLVLTNGENKKTLMGRLSVDVDVAGYKLYSNIKYDTLSQSDKLNDAIKKYDGVAPSKIDSLYKAEVPKEEEIDTSIYSLAITSGCMQVPQDGKYTFYLTSSGLCKVVFGVADHNFTMFENVLTVGEYTEELKYDISLQKGYKYYYTIYVLSNKGSGYANLGIKSNLNEKIEQIDRDYLIYNHKKLTRNNIVDFNPSTNMEVYTKQESIDKPFQLRPIREFTEGVLVEQKSKIKVESDLTLSKYYLIMTLESSSKLDYFYIDSGMPNVNIKVASGSDFSNILIDSVLNGGKERFEITDNKIISEVKVEFSSDTPFELNILDLKIGEKLKEMDIVSSSSTDIEYIGEWKTSHDYIGMNNSVTISSSSLSSISYKFNGDEIAVFAIKDKNFGTATIYIDGHEVHSVDFESNKVQCAQLIFNAKLEKGDHVIEIKANSDKPIALDYFAVSKLGETKIKNDFSKLWYVVFIPAIVIIVGIVCIALDIKEKKKKS